MNLFICQIGRAGAAALLLLACLLPASVLAQQAIDPSRIQIVRDSYGVPHIYAPTDPEVAYGLAWVTCEDHFKDMQEHLMAARGRLGEVIGKNGALMDYFLTFTGIDTLVPQRFDKDLSPEYRRMLDGYVQGLNAYASAHPDELLLKGVLPYTAHDVVKGSMIPLCLMAGMGMAFKGTNDGVLAKYMAANDARYYKDISGSNAVAVSGKRSADGQTYLLINSHQPNEGRFAWFEAHLCSQEGWNILGGLFPGGTSIFVGVNEHLGWAHTNNYHTFGDVYELKVKGGKYLYDGVWKKFGHRTAHLKVKLGGIKLAVNKKILNCEYGPVFKKKGKYYAFRFPAYHDIRALDQWYHMNKAKNFQEFKQCLQMESLPLFNTVYADKESNIYYISDGKIPLRDPKLDWSYPLAGTGSAVKWTGLIPFAQKPQVENPNSGYVFNANNSPLLSTAPADNWKGNYPGLQLFVYNRGERFDELFQELEGKKIGWDDFVRIKYDCRYSTKGTYARNFAPLYGLSEDKYPRIADAIRHLKAWDRNGTIDNTHAALAALTHKYLEKEVGMRFSLLMISPETPVTEENSVIALTKAKKFLMKHYGRLDVPYGTVHRLTRGDKSLPTAGMDEVLLAAHPKIDEKKGIIRCTGGDCYYVMAKFDQNGPSHIESINTYGTSSRPESVHYTDQMEMFVNRKTKPMTLDKEEIFKKAVRIYNPK